MLFAGDFSQLKPVPGESLLSLEDFSLWHNKVSTLIELQTNHRFHSDPELSVVLEDLRSNGPTHRLADSVN